MLKKELEKYKKILLKKREELTGEINHIARDALTKSQREASGDLSGYTFHMADLASDSYDREFSLNLASDNQKVLYEIDEALKRIEDKSYGSCLKCGKTITKKRLNAVAFAKYCLACQAKEEGRSKRG
jgi:RNA polymerase-binding protein DksA